MTDRRRLSEVVQRRHICNRIKELKLNCEHLSKVKGDLSARLNDMNSVVDRLIEEKRTGKYNPHLKIDLKTCLTNRIKSNEQPQIGRQDAQENITANDLINIKHNTANTFKRGEKSSESPEATTDMTKPSYAFKMKITRCLTEITPVVESIKELCDQACDPGVNDPATTFPDVSCTPHKPVW